LRNLSRACCKSISLRSACVCRTVPLLLFIDVDADDVDVDDDDVDDDDDGRLREFDAGVVRPDTIVAQTRNVTNATPNATSQKNIVSVQNAVGALSEIT
jgi:hypothetical protein